MAFSGFGKETVRFLARRRTPLEWPRLDAQRAGYEAERLEAVAPIHRWLSAL